MMQHGQKSLFGGVRRCLCGFHIQKVGLTLPRLWAEGIPPKDHRWITKTLFRMGAKGKVELQDNLKLWYYPPQPSPLYHQALSPDHFFTHPLLMWMPYKLWKVKITKKLAGTAKRTALWLTSVGNEHGQILISVLTAQEGAGLDRMASDLVKRYEKAGVDPPVALYVDCGCCAEAAETTKLQARFSGWPQLLVMLDIWHFMRRLALGCTTDAHQLYPLYMSRMSACIFEWDAGDLALLREAKAQQLQAQGPSSADVDRHLTREELALHCRRRTRGVTTTVKLLEELLDVLMGSRGNDSLGVPLFDQERMEHIWRVQRKHVKCIQDPLGV
ncbi:hypothetical protein GOODEAATRI_029781 [Goodea atripinnis]|uniref:DUF6729 domain-containing protein n=1 Tax=Goodea atripinnis TaxID=208336 RepID=A0ABV0NEU7_9TELE